MVTRISKTRPEKFVTTEDQTFGGDESSVDSELLARARQILAGECETTRDIQELYEPVVASNLNIAVFGAGHVGSAVVQSIASIDCSIRWIDSRRRVFRKIPANVRAIEASEPALEVAAMPPNSFYLVMTHSHALDFEICDRILRRSDVRYCGLIGSISKRRRFEKRFRQQGLSQPAIDSLICPIGVDGISGKKPAEIAVSVAAEILKRQEAALSDSRSDLPDNVHHLRH